jgi:nitroimidazol reductase NimA-like FMN-containing flavoprotein (pyridoxamine 5'-phosphate oxidase superfamily)
MTPKDNKVMDKELRKALAEVLISQNMAVLATHGDGQSYCTLVGYAALPDLKSLVFATMRSTRKFGNLKANPQVAMMIDTRTPPTPRAQPLACPTANTKSNFLSVNK